MEKKIRNVLLVLVVIIFSIGISFAASQGDKGAVRSPEGKAAVKPQKEKAPVVTPEKVAPAEKSPEKKATLKVVPATGNTAGIELTNTVPVRGVQFTGKGVKLTEVRTTSRTPGFLAKFNEENGIVLVLSLTDEEVAPGTGLIAEIIYEKPPAPGSAVSIADIKIVGRAREEL